MTDQGGRSKYQVDVRVAQADSLVSHARSKLLYHELAPYFEQIVDRDSDLEADLICAAFDLASQTTGTLVDLGCGVGRLLARVSERAPGVRCLGLDLSHDVLRVAQGRGLDVVRGDMRRPTFRQSSIDFAMCMWSTYNYLSRVEDRLEFLARAGESLARGGFLLIDSIWRPDGYSAVDRREIDASDVRGTVAIEKFVRGTLNEATYTYDLTIGSADCVRRFVDQELCVMLTVDDIANEAAAFGLELVSRWDSYKPGSEGHRQIALLQRTI